MADVLFNVALASIAEKVRDGATVLGVLLLTAAEADDALRDHDNLSALLGAAGNTEAVDASAARKTGLTGVVTVDDVNNLVDTDLPDQVFTALAGAAIVKAIIFYEESASDAGRIPLAALDWAITPDGSDVTLELNANGFHRSTG